MPDQLNRFIFDDFNIRGVTVKIASDVKPLLSDHQYPDNISCLLLEAVAINAMLSTTLKFRGRISLQLQTTGDLNLLLVQTTDDLQYRGVVRWSHQPGLEQLSFAELTQNGQMVITIEPDKGQRYQGIVELNASSLMACIENYFAQSEQLLTRLRIFSDPDCVFGILLQALPDLSSEQDFEDLEILVNSLTQQEALELEQHEVLKRLFHEQNICAFSEQAVTFNCGCSREKMLSSIQVIGEEEIADILSEEGHIEVQCEFCLSQYQFNDIEIKSFGAVTGNLTKH